MNSCAEDRVSLGCTSPSLGALGVPVRPGFLPECPGEAAVRVPDHEHRNPPGARTYAGAGEEGGHGAAGRTSVAL